MQVITRDERRHNIGERPSDGIRTAFQRDRDRILYSTAFRRLAGVTQVVHAAEGHAFHNRLTHSLKVAQVGRRLSERLLKHTSADTVAAIGGVDPDVVEAACLAHDLGHPPFGHAAEKELDKLIVAQGVPDGFEGNPQSFRIVTHVEVRLNEFRGLNLTSATLNALLKYPRKRSASNEDPEHAKWGYYFSEAEDFKFARARETDGSPWQSAEAAIMDWADDVSFAVHDLDDGYRAGLVPFDQLLQKSRERDRFISWYADELHGDKAWADQFFDLLHTLSMRELTDPFQEGSAQFAALNTFTAMLICRYLGFDVPDAVKLVDATPRLEIDEELRKEIKLLKSLMRRYVYDHPSLRTHQFGQREVIRCLFEFMYESIRRKDRGLIPFGFRSEFDTVIEQSSTAHARLVTDIVGSMTESQAMQLYHRIMGIAPGSIYDTILRR